MGSSPAGSAVVAAQAVLTAEPAGFVLVGQPVTGPPSAATSSVPSGTERAAAAGGGADEPPAQPVICSDDIAVQQMLLDDAASPDSRAGGNIVDPSSDGPFLCAAGTFCQLPSVPVPELKHLCRGCQLPLHGLCGALTSKNITIVWRSNIFGVHLLIFNFILEYTV